MKYTYNINATAKYANKTVVIPDQVYNDQHLYDQKSFPALLPNGKRVQVVLRGDLYGLTKGVLREIRVVCQNRNTKKEITK